MAGKEVSVIERAKQHFTGSDPETFEVPEWGVKVYPKHETLAD